MVMKKIAKHSIMGILVTVMLSALFPTVVSATHGFSSGLFTVSVDGTHFEIWGYHGDVMPGTWVFGFGTPAFRLRDIAYVLNGTPAQFEILEIDDDRWDFWIKRGEMYTVTGTEMQPILEHRNALFGSYGFLPCCSHGFGSEPHQGVILGIDGDEYPAITIPLGVIQDVDDMYFSLSDLAFWLGFDLEWVFIPWVESRYAITTIPTILPTPSHHIRRDTFPIGTVQTISYAHVLTVRVGPGNHYNILTFVHRGDEFTILDYYRRFVQICTPEGLGWIFAGFLSRSPAIPKSLFNIFFPPDLSVIFPPFSVGTS